jgi:hypothetical protein
MVDEPRYWGSWKGRVIRAIALDHAFSWGEIRDITGLSPKSLNQVLAQLFDSKTIKKKENGDYWVSKDLYKEYNNYIQNASKDEVFTEKRVKISTEQQSNLIGQIDEWIDLHGLNISLKPEHFFIDGKHLDALSNYLIDNSKKEVLVINPFVDRCNMTESLIQAQKEEKKVILVCRPPNKSDNYYLNKKEYHEIIRSSGINLTYNKIVHAKLMVLDRSVAIISSMNLYSGSTAGASWEAGIVSTESTVVESVMDAIFTILEKPESHAQ